MASNSNGKSNWLNTGNRFDGELGCVESSKSSKLTSINSSVVWTCELTFISKFSKVLNREVVCGSALNLCKGLTKTGLCDLVDRCI
jgi:hypothetical protein